MKVALMLCLLTPLSGRMPPPKKAELVSSQAIHPAAVDSEHPGSEGRDALETRVGVFVAAGMVAATAVVTYFVLAEPGKHPAPPRPTACFCDFDSTCC